MKPFVDVLIIVGLFFMLCYANQMLYLVISILRRKEKPMIKQKHLVKKEKKNHRFGVLICARNESTVIKYLIDDVKRQDYDTSLVDVFVIADNCTDNTAEVARLAGAHVYERTNKDLVGKGYALKHLYNKVKEDFGNDHDAFIVFDADNLLDQNFIRSMNRMLIDGYRISASYRNTKNFSDSWVSAGYSYWYLHDSQQLNRSRYQLGLSSQVSGTGFMFTRELMDEYGGWNFHTLTEDIEFTVFSILRNEPIGYCHDAMLYDEQPQTLKESWKQRMRWAKGGIQVYMKYLPDLTKKAIFDRDLSALDSLLSVAPAFILGTISAICYAGILVTALMTGSGFLYALQMLAMVAVGGYTGTLGMAIAAFLTERKKVVASNASMVFHIFTFPIYMMTWLPIAISAVFSKVEWEPIKRNKTISSQALHSTNSK